MRSTMVFITLILLVLAVVQSKKNNDKTCNNKIEYTQEGLFSLLCGKHSYLNCLCNDTMPDIKGTYVRQDQHCKSEISSEDSSKASAYHHKVIGLGAAVALLSVLLLIETGGLLWTCWIMRKTTEISNTLPCNVKPKQTAKLINQYNEHQPPPDNGSTFQPSIKYSLMGPGYDNSLNQWSATVEDQIYEVLDGDENHLLCNTKATGVNRSVTISGNQSDLYDNLDYSDNPQNN